MAKPNDRVFFTICSVAGGLILLGCALPAFELYLDASVGAGDSQKVYHFTRDLRLITNGEPGALVFSVVGVGLALLGVAGVFRSRWWFVVAVAAVCVPAFVQTVRTVDYATSPGDTGVYTCETEPRLEGCIGYLAPAVRDFRADILRKPEARQPEYLGPGRTDFNIRKLAGWQLVGWSVILVSLVAWFRALLLVIPTPLQAAAVYVPLLLVILVVVIAWWLRDFEF